MDDQSRVVRISLCFGLTVATLAQTIGHVSGCHVNPAVTLGLVVGRKMGMMKGLLYAASQCLGAITGAAILSAVVPEGVRGAGGLGMTVLGGKVSTGQAVAVEMVITMVLVMAVLAAADDGVHAATAPLSIGLSITSCHLFAVPLTGSGMNPARSLGPALVQGQMINQWVYWVGPGLGGVLSAVFYQLVLRARGTGGRGGGRGRKVNTVRRFIQVQSSREEDSPPYSKNTDAGVSSNYLISTQ